jgi:predicted GNAT family acetyltransferase
VVTITVHTNPEQSRYELVLDGRLAGIADYWVRGDTVVMPHTEIDSSLRGRGLGEILVRHALDDLRRAKRRVVPACWYVAQFIDEHPEYRDLLSGRAGA